MKKLLIVLLIALAICKTEIDDDMFQEFIKFMKKYKKKYNSINEFLNRFEIFKTNFKKTSKEANGLSFQTGITKFSDLTPEEFEKKYLTLNINSLSVSNFEPYIVKGVNVPEEWDWNEKGYVTRVKDQGECSSCWAFTSIGNLEGQYFKRTHQLESFSEQMLIDCDDIDRGCHGGLMQDTFNWIKERGGIMKESDYPYEGYKGICKNEASKYVKMKVTGFKKLGKGGLWSPVDENEMKEF